MRAALGEAIACGGVYMTVCVDGQAEHLRDLGLFVLEAERDGCTQYRVTERGREAHERILELEEELAAITISMQEAFEMCKVPMVFVPVPTDEEGK